MADAMSVKLPGAAYSTQGYEFVIDAMKELLHVVAMLWQDTYNNARGARSRARNRK